MRPKTKWKRIRMKRDNDSYWRWALSLCIGKCGHADAWLCVAVVEGTPANGYCWWATGRYVRQYGLSTGYQTLGEAKNNCEVLFKLDGLL